MKSVRPAARFALFCAFAWELPVTVRVALPLERESRQLNPQKYKACGVNALNCVCPHSPEIKLRATPFMSFSSPEQTVRTRLPKSRPQQKG